MEIRKNMKLINVLTQLCVINAKTIATTNEIINADKKVRY
jgi:hypothetical protein